jgi:hypothetical protein
MIILLIYRKEAVSILRSSIGVIRSTNPAISLLFVLVLITTLGKSILYPANFDTAFYHAQAIHWIESFRVVPGLGNLHGRLAFDSSWFLASALFSFSFLEKTEFHILGGYLLLLVIAYCLIKLTKLFQGDYRISNFAVLGLIFLARRLFSAVLSSPDTDTPATLISWVIFLLSMEKIEDNQESDFDLRFLLILCFSLFVITVKISILPIFLLPLYFIIRQLPKWKLSHVLILFGISLVFIIPWLTRNVIESGYLVYPYPNIDLFHVDWKIPQNIVQIEVNDIKSYARVPNMDEKVVLTMPLKAWLPLWFQHVNSLDKQHIYAISITLAILLTGISFYIIKARGRLKIILHYSIPFLIAIIGILFWFFQAPNFRFGYGFIGILLSLNLATLFLWLSSRYHSLKRLILISLFLFIFCYQGMLLYKMRDLSVYKGYWLLPASYQIIQTEARMMGNFYVDVPVSGVQCGYFAFPCAPVARQDVFLRGDSFELGFRSIDLTNP